jgi:hypothetical protein
MNGKRKFLLYFSWSRYREGASPLEILENRYPALFEFRRALYPHFEAFADSQKFNQFMEGFLDNVVLSDFEVFRKVIEAETNHLPEVVQREHGAGENNFLNKELLENAETGSPRADTLIIVSLDHFKSEQAARADEIEAVKQFLTRENSCLFVCPHHFIGDDEKTQVVEHRHHGDVLVPAQQKIGGFGRSLLKELGIDVENYFGLNPAANADGSPAPLVVDSGADELGVLKGVETFNLHPHLPHLEILNPNAEVRVLARQLINPKAPPHPFVKEGNTSFNALLWAKPSGERKGSVFVCDATMWSSAFGGLQSLKTFWKNIANLPVGSAQPPAV